MLCTGTVFLVITLRICSISCYRLAMLSLYLAMAASVLASYSWSTSFSEVTPSSFSESAFAVAYSCSRLVTSSSSSSLFFMRVCCSIYFSLLSFLRFSRSSSSWFSSLLHLALASLSAFWVMSSWCLRLRSMFSAASRWERMVAYYFSSCPTSLLSFWQVAWVLSCKILALVILAANSLRIFLSCINKINSRVDLILVEWLKD